jgi:hypothetical protein
MFGLQERSPMRLWTHAADPIWRARRAPSRTACRNLGASCVMLGKVPSGLLQTSFTIGREQVDSLWGLFHGIGTLTCA